MDATLKIDGENLVFPSKKNALAFIKDCEKGGIFQNLYGISANEARAEKGEGKEKGYWLIAINCQECEAEAN